MGKAWYRANREKAKAYNREWRKKHPEKSKEYYRAGRVRDPERRAKLSREWRKNNREKDRANSRRARAKNPEKAKAAVKAWGKLHVEERRMYCRKRRARLLEAKGTFSMQQWFALKKRYNNTCLCCGKTERQLAVKGLVVSPDHVVPLSKGGSNSLNNIQPLCHGRYKGTVGGCNEKKGVKTTDYRRKHETFVG